MGEQQKESNLHQPNYGWIAAECKACQTCMFVEVREPFGRLPKVGTCKIYEAPESKPQEVMFGGEPCEYYEKDKRKFEK